MEGDPTVTGCRGGRRQERLPPCGAAASGWDRLVQVHGLLPTLCGALPGRRRPVQVHGLLPALTLRRPAEGGPYRCMGFCQRCAVRRPAEDGLYRCMGFCLRWALHCLVEGGPYKCMGFCLYGTLWRPAAGTTNGARVSACTEHRDPRPRKRRTGAWTFSDCSAYGLPVVAGVQPPSSVASGAACGAVALCGLEQSRKLSRAGLGHSSYASAAHVS